MSDREGVVGRPEPLDFSERIQQVREMHQNSGGSVTLLGAYWEGYEQGLLFARGMALPDLLAAIERADLADTEFVAIQADLAAAQAALQAEKVVSQEHWDYYEAERVAKETLQQHVDAAWQAIERAFDIEPRAYFEAEAPVNGFKCALAQAVHHLWKRDPKLAALQQERDDLVHQVDCMNQEIERQAQLAVPPVARLGPTKPPPKFYFTEDDNDSREAPQLAVPLALEIRCAGRYPVPATSPPRDEPFDVTYRCAMVAGHFGPCGNGEAPQPTIDPPVNESDEFRPREDFSNGCPCRCCDHGEGSECACDCHRNGPCSYPPAENARLRKLLSTRAPWLCKARQGLSDPPQDCDWPTCGCDPAADKVIDALQESGKLAVPPAPRLGPSRPPPVFYFDPEEDGEATEPIAAGPPAVDMKPAFRMTDAAEMLWVVLANVSGGDWTQQSADWQEAAARWRDNYFKALAGEATHPPGDPPWTMHQLFNDLELALYDKTGNTWETRRMQRVKNFLQRVLDSFPHQSAIPNGDRQGPPSSDGITAACWYCAKPGYRYRHTGDYNISLCDACRDAGQKPALTALVARWEARAALEFAEYEGGGTARCVAELRALLEAK